MEDIEGKLSLEKGSLFNTSENVSMTVFLLTQEIPALCRFLLCYTTIFSLKHLFLCFANLFWKVILLNTQYPAKLLPSAHKRVL